MRETIRLLREGWYGTGSKYEHTHPLFRKPVNCKKLWEKCLVHASTIFVNLCRGIQGAVGSLTVNPNYVEDKVKLPIDTLVVDSTKDDGDGEEMVDFGDGEQVLL